MEYESRLNCPREPLYPRCHGCRVDVGKDGGVHIQIRRSLSDDCPFREKRAKGEGTPRGYHKYYHGNTLDQAEEIVEDIIKMTGKIGGCLPQTTHVKRRRHKILDIDKVEEF